VIEAGETCDDGNTVDGDGCSHRCIIEACGDGLVQFGLGETCDDGNTVSGDGCDSTCHVEPFQTVSPVKVSAALSCTTSVANAARKIAIDGNGTIYAVMTCGSDAYFVVSTNRGQSYSAPMSLSSDLPGAPVSISQVSVATGPTGIAYVAMMLSGGAVYLKTTLDFGSTWSSAVSIATSTNSNSGLSLQAFNDDIYIGFRDSSGVAVMRNHNHGSGSFASTSVAMAVSYFDLLYDAVLGSLIVASDNPSFHIRSSSDSGVTFGAEVNPSGSEYYSDWALGNGRIYVSGTALMPPDNSTLLYVIPTGNLSSSTSVSGLPSVSSAQTRTLAADTSGNAFVASQLDSGGVRLDRLPYGGNTLDTPRTLSATGGSPVVGPLPGGAGAAVVYSDGTSVYVTVQAY
jgi:cysteine-rich repeat protein